MLILLAALGGCGGGGDDSPAPADSARAASDTLQAAGRQERAIRVDAAEVRLGDLVVPIRADGAIRTPLSVEVRAKIGGQLLEVRVRDGDRVRAGQLLARIDPREHALQLEEARHRHLQALSRYAAEGEVPVSPREAQEAFAARRSELEERLRRGEIADEQFSALLLELELAALEQGAFRRQLHESRSGLAETRLAEERARLSLDHTEIRAPFTGVVESVTAVPGEILGAGARICRLYNNDRLEAVLHVLESDLGNLQPGRAVLLAVPATGDTLEARVDVISPRLDESSRTCEVLVRFDNDQARFRPGMFARAEIAGWVHHDRLQVPKEAVLVRDDRPLVFKVAGDRAQWLYVDTGLENDDWIEIRAVHSGGSLQPGDRVVVSDHLTLAHEAKLDVQRTLPPRDRWASNR
ncbi:MAG: efflux RND transporter periplasmic adaptor subunit [Candidatus Eisenbacteria bacterium]|uniref:Efflux RND transporter periplasmic adaptor subunit n=1 Tax=Eiseniibacteriota bacterium TaxID=2212470 RepID=A0A937XBF4_UNCEI|nr:efflux RND transporter periplasmic adaptor subunit [Candidatus Eisenbacteria bacterium]